MDIEPYISDSWKENPEEYMDRYISCMKKDINSLKKSSPYSDLYTTAL